MILVNYIEIIKLTSIIRERKKQYFANFCENNRINTKIIWQQINQILGGDRSTVNNLNLNSDKINQFFANLGPTIIANLPSPTFSHQKFVRSVNNTFYVTEVTANELMNVVYSQPNKTSSGFGGLSTKNLKLIFPYISCVLLKIVNKSFMSGIFPDILKIARVLPLYKEGSLNKMIKFRPISILSSISKIFERLYKV